MLAEDKVNASTRLLVLTLNLLNTRLGLTERKLMELVPGYDTLKLESARRKFERDIASLRGIGLDVQTDLTTLPPRYSIPRSHYPQDIEFTDAEFQLLVRAIESWTDVPATQGGVVLNKLRAVSPGESVATPADAHVPLRGGAHTAILHNAIVKNQPVSFEYQARDGLETREVAPWNLIARGTALYLWGFDLNRWDARLFRLSRFRSTPVLIADQDATVPTGALEPREFDYGTFLVAPLLAVRKDGAPLVRLRCSEIASATEIEVPEGWEVLQGSRDDSSIWETAIMREADSVVVLAPQRLRETLLTNLVCAAGWQKSEEVQNAS